MAVGARRVLVDASAAFNQGAGIGRYAREVVPAAAQAWPEAIFALFYAPARPGPAAYGQAMLAALGGPSGTRVRRAPLSRRRLDQLWFRARVPLPVQALAGRADVVYSPDFTAPPALGTPRVVTVHDLAFLTHPEHAPAALRAYLRTVVPRQVAGAARVVAVSQTTRDCLIERLGVPPERVAVVANAVEERFFAAEPLGPAARAALGLPAAYVLCVGTLEPRKNHATLFAALRLLEGRLDLPLVVAGRRGWDWQPILAAGERLRRDGRVRFLDYVPEETLPGLYAGAAATVYPSWAEGFGLPVLESLAAGVPTVASTAPALREVAGAAALYADPGSAEDLAGAIERALAGEQRTEAARAARRERARRYRWEESGRALVAVLRAAAGRRRER